MSLEQELVIKLDTQSKKIKAAEMAGRTDRTLNKLWKTYFRIEDELKASQPGGGSW